MNLETDREDLLRFEPGWRDDPPPPPPIPSELRERARRGRRALWIVTLCELMLVVGALAAVVVMLRRHPDATTIVWAVAVVVFCALALSFAIRNRRGTWRPLGETCRDYLSLAEERCARRQRALRFATWLLLAEIAFLVPWSIWEWRTRGGAKADESARLLLRDALAVVVSITTAWWLVWYRGRIERERAELRVLRRQVED